MTLQIVMFAFLAVELVGVTAGEATDPKKTLPKAINTVPWRIAVFYVGALIVILSVVSWTDFEPGVSPFVAAFAKIGLPFGAGDRQLRRADRGALLLQLRHVLHRPDAARPRAERAGAEVLQPPHPGRAAPARHDRLRGADDGRRLDQLPVAVEGVHLRRLVRHDLRHVGLDHDPRLAASRYRAKADRGELPQSEFRAPGGPVHRACSRSPSSSWSSC